MGQLGLGESTLIMTLNAVFDESGKHNDCDLVVFGGLILDAQEIRDRFNARWGTLLRGANVLLPQGRAGPFLHMSELNNSYKKTSDRAGQRRVEALVESLAKYICESAIGGSWHSITVADFKSLSAKARRHYKDPFYHAFEAGVISLSKSACVGPTDDLSLICDDSDEYAVKCLESFKRLRKAHPAVSEKLPVIAFGDDKVYPPLQAADMFAYCYRAARSNPGEGLWSVPLQIFLSTFSDMSHEDIRLDDKGNIMA